MCPPTAEVYANNAPQNVTLSPLLGWDTVKPFIDAGKTVTILGCLPLLHPNGCNTVRAIVRGWSFADRIYHIVDCAELAQLLQGTE